MINAILNNIIGVPIHPAGVAPPVPATSLSLLLEDGGYLLLEDGGKLSLEYNILIDEASLSLKDELGELLIA